MSDTDRVLIVGAGIAGLALARRLNSIGIAFHIIDRQDCRGTRGAGLLLTGNAMRVLEAMGLSTQLRKRGRHVSAIRFSDENDRLLFDVDWSGKTGWPSFVSLRREALQDILLDASPTVTPRWGTTLVALKESNDAVEATLSDGTRGQYSLVVAADGVHSQLRTLIFGGKSAEPLPGFFGWRFLATCPPKLQMPQYMLGNGRTLLLHPLPDGEVYCGAGPIAGELRDDLDDASQLHDAFAAFTGFAPEILAQVGTKRLIRTRYWHVEQPTWVTKRCVLIGDAAHACAPTLAQGGAMALEDAQVLADVLAKHGIVSDALAAFELQRRPRVVSVQRHSLQRMAANTPLTERANVLRNTVLSQVGSTQLLDAWAPLMEVSP